MTSPESPSSLLERAADLIENLACGATLAKSPWKADGSTVWSADDFLVLGVPWENDGDPDDDAAWIATLNPSVAPPLVAWLRQAAAYFDRLSRFPTAEVGPQADTDPYAGPAVQFARLILGES